MGGPDGPQKERKIERYNESLDIKLNLYLMKWIVLVIFYQTSFIWSVFGWILPAMPAIKLSLCIWIATP